MDLFNYLQDGANWQARAILSCIQRNDGMESSGFDNYPQPKIARWENCREQGYVITVKSSDYQKQLNIAFFEHRNSDDICAVKWEQLTINPPTIESANFGDVYRDKWDISFSVKCCEFIKIANWIYDEIQVWFNICETEIQLRNDSSE